MNKITGFCTLSYGVIGLLLILLSACDATVTSPNMPAAKTTPHAHAVKPGAAVKLVNSQPIFWASPGVGNVELVLSVPAVSGAMQVAVSTSSGVELVSSPAHYEFSLAQDAAYRLPLQLEVAAEGRYYINLQIVLVHGEQREQRILTAILQVGVSDVKAQKGGANRAGESEEEKVISAPAQESIQPAR